MKEEEEEEEEGQVMHENGWKEQRCKMVTKCMYVLYRLFF